MRRLKFSLCLFVAGALSSCSNQFVNPNSTSIEQLTLDVVQTSGQLASGLTFSVVGSSTDSTTDVPRKNKHGKHGGPGGKHAGVLDGLNLLAPTNELLAIVDAETSSDIRGLRISKNGGATITHYNASGETVTLQLNSNGPQGCSFSGNQYKGYDSLLATIVKTQIDFGSGVTYTRDTVEIIRSGKIIIERTGTTKSGTEVTKFENYFVNGIRIEGIKTRTSTFAEATGKGWSATTVVGGRITFTDGSVATWTSDRTRNSEIIFDDNGKIEDGTITTEVNTVVAVGSDVIYSHKTVDPLIEDLSCDGKRRGPVTGTLETEYGDDTLVVNYGDGSCTNRTITITLNGVTITKTIM